MRIPVNSCIGCNQNVPLKSGGVHSLGEGKYMRCVFIDAELDGYKGGIKFIAAYTNKRAAVRRATKEIAGLLWIGQAPRNIWLVVR